MNADTPIGSMGIDDIFVVLTERYPCVILAAVVPDDARQQHVPVMLFGNKVALLGLERVARTHVEKACLPSGGE